MRIAVAARAATSLADSRRHRGDHEPTRRTAARRRPGSPGEWRPRARPEQQRRRAAAVRVGHHEAHPVTHPQQVDDGRVGDPQRHGRGSRVAAQQPAGHRASLGQHLAAGIGAASVRPTTASGSRDRAGRDAVGGVRRAGRGRPPAATVPPGRSRRAVHTVTVSGGGGDTAWSPTSTRRRGRERGERPTVQQHPSAESAEGTQQWAQEVHGAEGRANRAGVRRQSTGARGSGGSRRRRSWRSREELSDDLLPPFDAGLRAVVRATAGAFGLLRAVAL